MTGGAPCDTAAARRIADHIEHDEGLESWAAQTIRALAGDLEATRAVVLRLARGIVRGGIGRRDHACRECWPEGEIAIDGFQCVYHEAAALAAPAPAAEAVRA